MTLTRWATHTGLENVPLEILRIDHHPRQLQQDHHQPHFRVNAAVPRMATYSVRPAFAAHMLATV